MVTFQCGEHSRLVIGDKKVENVEIDCAYSKSNGNASWTLNKTFFDTVKCDCKNYTFSRIAKKNNLCSDYCTLISPINSSCFGQDRQCDTVGAQSVVLDILIFREISTTISQLAAIKICITELKKKKR